ncbi:MAG: HEAT repeat domain-containing protein [Nitrospirae bacterium]|nr:HEAT repeat domain-containing protein [Nitrospirota bacterium]
MKESQDIFRKINEIAAEKAAINLRGKLQEDKFIPLELERGIVWEKEHGENEREDSAKEWDHSRQWDNLKLIEIFKDSNSYILSSSVGAGKTTFLYWLAGEIIKKDNLIPISLTCRDFEKKDTWEAVRRHLVSTCYSRHNVNIRKSDIEKYFDYYYDSGQCVFLVDGLDQIKGNSYSEVVEAILDVSLGNYSIITSRPSAVIAFDTDTDKIFLRLKSFSDSQQREYFDADYERAKRLSVYASDLISVPMLAHMVKTLIKANKDEGISNRTELYSRFINHIIMEHSPNDVFSAEDFGKTDKVQAALKCIAFKSLDLKKPEIQKVPINHHDESLFGITVDELTTFGLVNKIIERGDRHERFLFFTHQSFQEYLAACYINEHEKLIKNVIDEMWSPKWKEVIKFLCGLKGIEIIEKIYSRNDNVIHSVLFMAATCLPETTEIDAKLRSKIIERLKGLINNSPFDRPAMYCLGSIGEIEYVVDLLKYGDYNVRDSAVKALSELKDRIDVATIDGIAALLNDKDGRVRRSAVKALAELKDRIDDAMIDRIAALLNDMNSAVCSSAVEALAGLKDRISIATIDRIAALLDNDYSRVRSSAAKALAGLKDRIDDAMIDRIAALLNDMNSAVRNSAVEALAELKDGIDDAVIDRITDLLNDENFGVRHSVTEALTDLKDRISIATINRIAALLDDKNSRGRRTAVKALARLKDKINYAMIDRITDLLNDENGFVRYYAAEALAGLKDMIKQETIDRITDLLNDEDGFVRYYATEALAGLKDMIKQETIDRITDLLNDENIGVRRSAVRILADLKDRIDNATIDRMAALLNDDDSGVRRSAIEAFAKLKDMIDNATIDRMAALLNDENRAVRRRAVIALTGLKDRIDDVTIDHIAALLNDTDWKVSRQAVIVLAGLRDMIDVATIDRIAAILNDENSHGREAALKTLTTFYESGILNKGVKMIKTVVELDLKGYRTSSKLLEEHLGVEAVKMLNDQIQGIIDKAIDSKRASYFRKPTGDGSILAFQKPMDAHEFAEEIHYICRIHNHGKQIETAKRWFRIGIATGNLAPDERDGHIHDIAGIVIGRAVCLEAAAKIGEILIDADTYASLPVDVQAKYGAEEQIVDKDGEQFPVHRYVVVHLENKDNDKSAKPLRQGKVGHYKAETIQLQRDKIDRMERELVHTIDIEKKISLKYRINEEKSELAELEGG